MSSPGVPQRKHPLPDPPTADDLLAPPDAVNLLFQMVDGIPLMGRSES